MALSPSTALGIFDGSCSATGLSISRSGPLVRNRFDDALFFIHDVSAACGQLTELLGGPARPLEPRPLDLRARSQAKSDRSLGLREVARPAFHHLPAHARRCPYADDRPDAAGVRFPPDGAEAKAVIHASVVPVQRNWAVIGRHDHVEVAVVVEIGVGAAARDLGRREGGADQLRDIAELPEAFVVELVRRLGIAHARFDARYG